MAYKFTCSLLLLAVVASVALSEPARFRGRSSRFQLARQEEAPQDPAAPGADPSLDVAPTPASAPYPPAGITPEVPFDLPTETEAQPDLTYGPPAEPDNTYGPPAEPDNTYGPPAEPDNTYGPPADAAPADQAAVDDALAAEPIPASLIQPRNGRLRSRRPVPEKLRSAQIVRSRPVLVYTI
ncbi:mucin-7 [Drosophila miranda]|uniref:mucin-7 n=1 Tax=Drosophila miranda TaxID=7229 RepID=UPI0007E8AC97|nr:mucin-7 [Drosophila miranda]